MLLLVSTEGDISKGMSLLSLRRSLYSSDVYLDCETCLTYLP
jgi:hypothetical protein